MAKLKVPVGPDDHAQGPADAPVTLLEYGDYECSHWGHAYPIVKALQRKFGNQLRFVFRNFPLNTIHEHAGQAAQAAEAAGGQGKFWEMHDLLYEHQHDLADLDLVHLSIKLGLEVYRFSSGVRNGVNGTPTFFINSQRHDGDFELETLLQAIQKMIHSHK